MRVLWILNDEALYEHTVRISDAVSWALLKTAGHVLPRKHYFEGILVEEMFPRYYMHSNICNSFKSSITK